MDFDYVIVGAGSAGCVVANRLSADPSTRVLLLEAGPKDGSFLMGMPRGIARLNAPGSRYGKFYQASTGGNRPDETWVKGRTLGGSSSINGAIYMRGMPVDYDNWVSLGCTGWGWDAMGPCFEELEDHQLGKAAHRGIDGPLKVGVPSFSSHLADAMLAAARDMGTPTAEDINDIAMARTGALGRQPETVHKGRRFSAARAFLDPARGRSNLTIMTDIEVVRIAFEGRRATGVVLSDGRTVRAATEVIVAAGAIETPKLLQLSGVGPGSLLRSLGIDVVADRPAVGGHLLEHRYFTLQFRVKEGSHNDAFRGLGLARSVFAYIFGRGPLARSGFDLGGAVKTRPELDRPDAQIGIGLYALETKGGTSSSTGTYSHVTSARWPGITIGGYGSRPTSEGRIEIRSPHAADAPFIDANYLATPEDRETALAVFRWMRSLASHPMLAGFAPEEVMPGPAVQSDEEILDSILKTGGAGKHVMGTCRMGSDADAVVDTSLRVRGVEGVRVVDTSVFPAMVSSATNATAMAVALNAAKIIARARVQ